MTYKYIIWKDQMFLKFPFSRFYVVSILIPKTVNSLALDLNSDFFQI